MFLLSFVVRRMQPPYTRLPPEGFMTSDIAVYCPYTDVRSKMIFFSKIAVTFQSGERQHESEDWRLKRFGPLLYEYLDAFGYEEDHDQNEDDECA